MRFDLNKRQSKLLANFFSDLGKGFFLGAFGIAMVIEKRVELIIFSILFTTVCVSTGVYLLSKLE